MIKKIYKYEVPDVTSRFEILMPEGAEVLTVQPQHGKMCLWALVDPGAQKEARFFEWVMTGAPIHEDMGIERKYIGSYKIRSGILVYHLFEII